MGSTRALILLVQGAVFAFGRGTTAVRFIDVLVTALIRMLRGVAGYLADGAATRNHSRCRMTFSMAVFPEAMIVRRPAFPAVAAVSSPARLECGRQFMAATLRLARRTGT